MKKLLLFILPILLGWSIANAQTGQALNFDGNDRVVVPYAPGLNQTSEMTVEAWINPSDISSFKIIAGEWWSPSFFHFNLLNGYLEIYFDGALKATDPTLMPLNTWTHVAFTASTITDEVKLYRNGVQVGTTGSYTPAAFPSSTMDFIIGDKNTSGSSFAFVGNIDEVRLWDVARTETEIATNMSVEIPTTMSNLIANYHFNQGIAGGVNTGINTLTDDAGSSYTGNLVNFALNGATSNWVNPGFTPPPCIADQTVTAAQSTFVCEGSTTVDLGSTELGVDYYLRDELDSSIVDGPIPGTGSGISLNTGNINSITTYNVYATSGSNSGALNFNAGNDHTASPHDASMNLSAGGTLTMEACRWFLAKHYDER
jgi:hypothetical protein